MARRSQLWDASPELLDRRTQAMRLHASGLSIREIAAQMGTSRDQADRDVKNGLRMVVGDRSIELERDIDRERLNMMIRALTPAALQGSVEAAREIREITKRRAQLLGLDAPKTVKVQVEPVPVDAIADELRWLDEQLALNDQLPQPQHE